MSYVPKCDSTGSQHSIDMETCSLKPFMAAWRSVIAMVANKTRTRLQSTTQSLVQGWWRISSLEPSLIHYTMTKGHDIITRYSLPVVTFQFLESSLHTLVIRFYWRVEIILSCFSALFVHVQKRVGCRPRMERWWLVNKWQNAAMDSSVQMTGSVKCKTILMFKFSNSSYQLQEEEEKGGRGGEGKEEEEEEEEEEDSSQPKLYTCSHSPSPAVSNSDFLLHTMLLSHFVHKHRLQPKSSTLILA